MPTVIYLWFLICYSPLYSLPLRIHICACSPIYLFGFYFAWMLPNVRQSIRYLSFWNWLILILKLKKQYNMMANYPWNPVPLESITIMAQWEPALAVNWLLHMNNKPQFRLGNMCKIISTLQFWCEDEKKQCDGCMWTTQAIVLKAFLGNQTSLWFCLWHLGNLFWYKLKMRKVTFFKYI